GVPHHGIAEDPCLTFSVGMRAPSAAELMGDYIDTLAAEADESVRYTDPDLAPPEDPNEIDAAAMARVVEALNALRFRDPDRLGDWFGRFITRYRSVDVVAGDGEPPSRIEVEWSLQRGGGVLQRHPFSRMPGAGRPMARACTAPGRTSRCRPRTRGASPPASASTARSTPRSPPPDAMRCTHCCWPAATSGCRRGTRGEPARPVPGGRRRPRRRAAAAARGARGGVHPGT